MQITQLDFDKLQVWIMNACMTSPSSSATLRTPQPSPHTDPLDDWGLPAWTYHDADFYRAEKERIFRPSWQIVCHDSDIPNKGDWFTLDYIGESILLIRGDDDVVRAFTNVCRHRGSRLVDGSQGCAKKLVCPYHAWVYEKDGKLSGVPFKNDYPSLDMAEQGLIAVDHEMWNGFHFVRLKDDGGPSVATMMAPYNAMIAPHLFPELRALGRVTIRPRHVNWKNVGDNYADGLHIPVAHPGLTRLFAKSYGIETTGDVDRMWGDMVDRPSANLSERAYQAYLPEAEHLAPEKRRHWLYFRLWPNVAFDIYPDQVDFMQWLPTGPETCIIREISYALPDDRREMKAARYLNWRINRKVNEEDTALIARVQEGMHSATFSAGPLGASEVCLRNFARRMRNIIPEAREAEKPKHLK